MQPSTKETNWNLFNYPTNTKSLANVLELRTYNCPRRQSGDFIFNGWRIILRNRHLFLMGGSPPFGETIRKIFAELSLERTAVLFIKREGWRDYMNKYTRDLKRYGAEDFYYLPLSDSPSASLLKELEFCSGIIIGGGETEKYRNYIMDTAVGRRIQNMYREGIPVAGFSAGALICPDPCAIPPVDTRKKTASLS
ncbi:Type 1 glutamine amidotransferase-like domain-containing protein [Cytobacillus sp. NCCP-133]|uniref:Type 1 glutamine amidotransferase-like domain-containing protein n=1 Tax=Cytobacillus sp. NCCP-133 TaxID=766848 RepID=UPI002852664D|nr:Type 1 glutamine amidotransferase-like domain-containing protein [Cytobacillus sp. NCCP-133]